MFMKLFLLLSLNLLSAAHQTSAPHELFSCCDAAECSRLSNLREKTAREKKGISKLKSDVHVCEEEDSPCSATPRTVSNGDTVVFPADTAVAIQLPDPALFMIIDDVGVFIEGYIAYSGQCIYAGNLTTPFSQSTSGYSSIYPVLYLVADIETSAFFTNTIG